MSEQSVSFVGNLFQRDRRERIAIGVAAGLNVWPWIAVAGMYTASSSGRMLLSWPPRQFSCEMSFGPKAGRCAAEGYAGSSGRQHSRRSGNQRKAPRAAAAILGAKCGAEQRLGDYFNDSQRQD